MPTSPTIAPVGVGVSRQADAPLCLTRKEAAERCNIALSTFDDWRRRGIIPGPIPGTHRGNAKALAMALDRHYGIKPNEQPSAFEEWKRARDPKRHQHISSKTA